MFRTNMRKCLIIFLSSSFLAFGLYNIHEVSKITEGGVLGMTLLVNNWFSISPSLSGLIMNICCYLLGYKILGKRFIAFSLVSAIGFSAAYFVCELFPPLWPDLYKYPLLAAVLGALFVGIGAGLCVRTGAATGGDDAFAMSLSHITKIKIQWIYLISDLTVLGLSLTYLPIKRILYSILTVVLSGQIVGIIANYKKKISPPKNNPDY